MKTKMAFLLIIAISIALMTGCRHFKTGGEKVRGYIQTGMTKARVIDFLGNPDGDQVVGNSEALTYANLRVSGWSNDKADYSVILVDGRVTQYGSGVVRPGQNGVSTFIIMPFR